MTQVVVHDDKKNAIQKLVIIAKPGYVEKGFNKLEPLQKKDDEIINLESQWKLIGKRIKNKTLFIRSSIFTGTFSAITPLILIMGDFDTLIDALGFSVAVGLMMASSSAFTSGVIIDEDKRKQNWKKLKNAYHSDVQEWLHSKHKITVNETELDEITSKILIPDGVPHFITDSKTGYMYKMSLNESTNIWAIAKVNSLPLINTAAIEAPKMDDPQISDKLSAVNQKIFVLKNFALNTEDDYLFEKAIAVTHATVNLVQQLRTLGDTTYVDQAQKAFTLIETDLDTIIQNQKKEISAQFRTQQHTILSR